MIVKVRLLGEERVTVEEYVTKENALKTANSCWADQLWNEGDHYARLARRIENQECKGTWDVISHCESFQLPDDLRDAAFNARQNNKPYALVCKY
jgi:uncharacterized protein YdeI (YjbR/CyaY-like superfamily)